MKVRGSIYGTGKQLPSDREKFWDNEKRFEGIQRQQFVSHKHVTAGGVITKTVTIGNFYQKTTMGGHPASTPYLPPVRLIRATSTADGLEVEVECYVDSGFLAIEDYNHVDPENIQPSKLYQTQWLTDLYPLSDGDTAYQPQPADVVNDDYPPSFNFTEDPPSITDKSLLLAKTHGTMSGGQMAGNNTGKFRLWAQAVTGKPLTASSFRLPTVNSSFASLSTKGLFTESPGVYWQIEILGGVSARFTKLQLMDGWKEKIIDAGGGKSRLLAELHGLACASLTSEIEEVPIGGADLPDGSPLAYSWKFNWDGTSAAIVLHHATGSGQDGLPVTGDCNQMSIETSVVTMSLSYSSGFSVSISVAETVEWLFENGLDIVWYPGYEWGMCHWVAGCAYGELQTLDTASDVPLTCWYGAEVGGYENNTLVYDRHTRSYTASEFELHQQCPQTGQGYVRHCRNEFLAQDSWQRSGWRHRYSAIVGGSQSVSAQSAQYKQIAKTTGFTSYATWSVDCDGLGVSTLEIKACTDLVACQESVVETLVSDGIGFAGEVYTLAGTLDFQHESGSVSEAGSGMAHVIPFDNAECVILVERDHSAGNLTVLSGTYTNADWCQKYGSVWDYAGSHTVAAPCDSLDDGPWVYKGDYYGASGYQLTNPTTLPGSTSTPVDREVVDGTIKYIGRYYKSALEETVAVAVDSGGLTPALDPTMYWVTFDKSEPCKGHFPQVIQGLSPAIAGTASVDRQWGEGYPDEAAEADWTGVIGAG